MSKYRFMNRYPDGDKPLLSRDELPTEQDLALARAIANVQSLDRALGGREISNEDDVVVMQQRVETTKTLVQQGQVVGRTIFRTWEDRELEVVPTPPGQPSILERVTQRD
jgi:hypothetical protein